ncbi:MAG: hypothetical protein VYA71_02165 [Pseudomonadota bacterium]|nr:hypothetical protein [Pseudomonadota bacterium]
MLDRSNLRASLWAILYSLLVVVGCSVMIEAGVELNDGEAPMPEALIAFAKAELDPVKAPKAVHILTESPHSPVGKVQCHEAKAAIHGACG